MTSQIDTSSGLAPLRLPAERAKAPVPLHPSLLADIAEGLARSSSLWRSVVHHDEFERRPVRVVATDLYEVWVIGWMPGQGVDMHDHGDSSGHIVVTEGELTESVPSTRGTRAHTLAAGDGHALPFGTIHDVVNHGAVPATSIHVYSPPLDAMTYYDPDSLAALHTDAATWLGDTTIEPAPSDLAPVDVSRALHPATHD